MLSDNNIEKIDELNRCSNNFKEIKPIGDMSVEGAVDFCKSLFEKEIKFKEALNELKDEYVEELNEYSEFINTLPEEYFDVDDLRIVDKDELKKLREEFNNNKEKIIHEWEEIHGIEWPTYKEDVFIEKVNGEKICIRKEGQRYDVHHIHPLCLGGKNEVSNITPMNAGVHSYLRGIHRAEGALTKITRMLGDD